MTWRPSDDEIAETLGPPPAPPSVTCPQCDRTSHHPDDVANGYCGNCHDWTIPRMNGQVMTDQRFEALATEAERGYDVDKMKPRRSPDD